MLDMLYSKKTTIWLILIGAVAAFFGAGLDENEKGRAAMLILFTFPLHVLLLFLVVSIVLSFLDRLDDRFFVVNLILLIQVVTIVLAVLTKLA
ncbi:MAG: hypothetical protein AAF334_02820 [Pseudomonadota bacterium]